jgi:enamine deaminase RidA (YjgF/YER057c/UK114 family)
MMRTALLLVVLAAPAAAQQVEMFNPEGLAKPAPRSYSHIARAGKLIFIAGQVGRTADGKLAGPGLKEQLEQAYINLNIALKSQGATFANVTKLTTYVINIPEYRTPEMAALRAKYVGDSPPPNTLVQISQLAEPTFKIEIEAIAVLP